MAAKFFTPSKLMTAIRAGLLDEVINAIATGGNIEEADMHGIPGLPLRTACFEGNLEIVRELLNRGADINAIASDRPEAPLRLAQRGKHQSTVFTFRRSLYPRPHQGRKNTCRTGQQQHRIYPLRAG